MIRSATVDDVPVIHSMICELAEYEKARHEVRATEKQLRESLFGPDPAVFAYVAETEDGTPAGFVLWFLTYSTWRGTHGIHMEDLYVRPEFRGGGYGKALLTELARVCVERGYERLEWVVLDWNQPAIDFYRALGAERVDAWETFRLTDRALVAVGSGAAACAGSDTGSGSGSGAVSGAETGAGPGEVAAVGGAA
ncbi:GNAT family N-acetyltransferase [Streptomyces sp. GC420]|nr:GNAT family N-acetyltransferase [Streptomyces sp. GC420]